MCCSLAILDPSVATPWTYFLHLSLSSVILIDSCTESLVHVLMFIQAMRGLPCLCAPCNCLVSSWCDHSMLASLLWQCLTVPFFPSLLQLCLTYLFVFLCRIFLSPLMSKASKRVSSFFLSIQLSLPYVHVRMLQLLEVYRARIGWLLVLACLVHQYSEISELVSCPPSLSESRFSSAHFFWFSLGSSAIRS